MTNKVVADALEKHFGIKVGSPVDESAKGMSNEAVAVLKEFELFDIEEVDEEEPG
jgi:hypothetical protein